MPDTNSKITDGFKNKTGFALGRQLTIEYYECASNVLLDKNLVEKALLQAASNSGATIISSSFHGFNPQGVSGVVVIAESHFTVHAWPEHDYAAVDIFTCGDSIDLEVAINSMRDSFESKNVVISSDQNRGIISKPVDQNIGKVLKNSKIAPISWKEEYKSKNPWGVLTSVDIYKSDPDIIRNVKSIEQFVYQLCDLIDMKRYGKCQIVHFGQDKKVEGFSMTQLIETSLISGHFANASNAVYLDVFSCKFYEPREIAEFATSFFKGRNYKMQIALRQ
ncbi:MAG: adenosylmethionine decarboxylase [Deltaproteobacteria bacterium]|jgi:S-adenosylmethionine decarboxylase|nr:adenosylmethionine decarboxylase [Deltaproteobacteria bacterium]